MPAVFFLLCPRVLLPLLLLQTNCSNIVLDKDRQTLDVRYIIAALQHS